MNQVHPKGNCTTCVHYRLLRDPANRAAALGQCWANPPTAQGIPVQGPATPSAPNGSIAIQTITIRPVVTEADTCGWHDDGTDDNDGDTSPFNVFDSSPDSSEIGIPGFTPGRAPINLDDI